MLGAIRSWLSRSLENPRRPLDPWSQALGESLDGSLSVSGVRVSRDRALTYSAVWRAVSLISRTVAKLPLGVYRHVRPGRERDQQHPADWLLMTQPNEAMTPFVWKQLAAGHVLLEGNAYSYVARDAAGRPVELLPLDPARTWPIRVDRRLWYVHELAGGERRRLPAEDVLHVKGMGYDGLEGYSVLSKARDSVGGALAAQAYGGTFYRNSARPNVALTHPGRLSPEARRNLRESWERMHQGLDNSHRTAILEEGLGVTQLTINARDAQMIESRQFSLIDVANWFNIPANRLGANVSTSYGSLEQENQNFLDDAIDPWLVTIEEECEAKLLSGHQRARCTHAVSFDRFPLVRADVAQRGEFYSKALASGWLSPDEVRAREGLNPMPGGVGAVYFFPAGATPVGGDPDGPGGPAVAPGSRLLAVPDLRQQDDYDCGPAAVQAVCQFFGVGPAGRRDYIDALGTTHGGGTRPAAVLGLLSRLGLVATAAGSLEVADLARWFGEGRPVLCPVQAGDGPAAGHWVTVVGVGLGQVFVQDPAAGPRMVAEAEWLERWRDRDADGVGYERYGIAVGEDLHPAPAPAPAAGGDGGGPDQQGDPAPAPGPEAGQGGDGGRALRDAVRANLHGAMMRVVRRLRHQAERAAAQPAGFLRWLDGMWNDNADVAVEAVAPAWACWRAAFGSDHSADWVAGRLAGDVRVGLLEVAGEATAARLPDMVSGYFRKVESNPTLLPGWLDLFGTDPSGR